MYHAYFELAAYVTAAFILMVWLGAAYLIIYPQERGIYPMRARARKAQRMRVLGTALLFTVVVPAAMTLAVCLGISLGTH